MLSIYTAGSSENLAVCSDLVLQMSENILVERQTKISSKKFIQDKCSLILKAFHLNCYISNTIYLFIYFCQHLFDFWVICDFTPKLFIPPCFSYLLSCSSERYNHNMLLPSSSSFLPPSSFLLFLPPSSFLLPPFCFFVFFFFFFFSLFLKGNMSAHICNFFSASSWKYSVSMS